MLSPRRNGRPRSAKISRQLLLPAISFCACTDKQAVHQLDRVCSEDFNTLPLDTDDPRLIHALIQCTDCTRHHSLKPLRLEIDVLSEKNLQTKQKQYQRKRNTGANHERNVQLFTIVYSFRVFKVHEHCRNIAFNSWAWDISKPLRNFFTSAEAPSPCDPGGNCAAEYHAHALKRPWYVQKFTDGGPFKFLILPGNKSSCQQRHATLCSLCGLLNKFCRVKCV
jgi:hypothetical protein